MTIVSFICLCLCVSAELGMRVRTLDLTDFRNYTQVGVSFNNGLTVIVGYNGQGKTNLLEAIGVAGGLGSIRGGQYAAMVRHGADSAMVRCRVRTTADRDVSIEAMILSSGRSRFHVNRQRLARQSDLSDVLVVTVFSPDDLELVKGGPSNRRRWVDEALVASRPEFARVRGELDRVLRQRNALLRQVGARLDADAATTLDVWDDRLASVGDEIRRRRSELLEAVGPRLAADYEIMAGQADSVVARYESSWGDEPLASALIAARRSDLRRATTTVGPHRDDVALTIGGRPARTHASQGEQRSLALAMRLAADSEVRERRSVRPVLLLDDVFSELDRNRAAALLDALPAGQRILTTATSALPAGVRPDQVLHVHAGALGAVES